MEIHTMQYIWYTILMDYLLYILWTWKWFFSSRIKLQGVGCRYLIDNSEPYYPWNKIVECKNQYKNQESKRGTYMQIITNGSHKPLYQNWLTLRCYIKSNTAHNMYGLKLITPETKATIALKTKCTMFIISTVPIS